MIFDHQDHLFSLVDALSAIRVLSRMPMEGVPEKQLLAQALEALMAHQDLEHCSVFLLDGDVLQCVVGGGGNAFSRRENKEFSDDVESMQFSMGEGIMGLACQTGQIQYCRNCKTDTRFRPFEKKALFYGDGSVLSMPIASDDKVLGVLNVSHHLPEFFETWHQHFLVLFANSLGRLLHLHRLINQLGDEVASRTQALEQALEESEMLRNRYQQLSIKDELTKLYNRRYFFAEGESLLARAVRYELPLSLVLIDVDHFKRVNDTWGHAVGDQVLCRIAETLLREARAGDLVARLGGEEFVLVLPNTAGDGLEMMASRIQEQIINLGFQVNNERVDLTVSIGMTSLNGQDNSKLRDLLDVLYHEADCAMYQCKLEGRNRRLFYSQEMEPSEKSRPEK